MKGKKMSEVSKIYHYCSNETMYKIIKNKQLWMSDISRSNDYSEMQIFRDSIFFEVERAYKESPFKFDYKNAKGISAIEKLLHDVDNVISFMQKDGSFTSFVVCFSEKEDLLSQWRGYANNGYGCSLGFSVKELKEYCNNNGDLIDINKVEYVNREQCDLIVKDKAKEILTAIKGQKNVIINLFPSVKSNNEKIDILLNAFMVSIFVSFFYDSLKYKWDTFKEEREWRLYFKEINKEENLFDEIESVPEWQKLNKEWMVLNHKIDFYVRQDCLVPYFPLELTELSKKPIKSIMLGPKNINYEKDINLLFKKMNLGKPNIKYSKISYR